MVFYNGGVYVFGGSSWKFHRSGERLDIWKRQWKTLGDMNTERCMFNPCVKDMKIYLVGGCTQKAEVFDTVKEQYADLPWILPENGHASAVFFQEHLMVFTHNWMCRWKPGTGESLEEQKHELCRRLWSAMKPVIFEGCVFFIADDTAWKVNLNTSESVHAPLKDCLRD
jgi:hypothetical protein